MNKQEARSYQPIWHRLKTDPSHTCVLTITDEVFLTTIKRMISKEKDLDEGFKIINEIECFKLKFLWDPEKKELTIKLASRLGLTEIKG